MVDVFEPQDVFRNDAPLKISRQLKPLGDMLDGTVSRCPTREAIVFYDDRYTYRELQQQANAFAKGLLQLGVQKGDHVGILMGNYPEFEFALFGAAKIGAVTVPINTRFRISELEYILRQGDVTTLIMNDLFLNKIDFIDMLGRICPEQPRSQPGALHSAALPVLGNVIVHSPAGRMHPGTIRFQDVLDGGRGVTDGELAMRQAEVRLGDVAEILYTSGTTGYPKGVMRNHYHVLHQGLTGTENMDLAEDEEIFFNANPLFHNLGNAFTMVASAVLGGKHVFTETFDPALAMEIIEREKCTVFMAFAPFFVMLTEHPALSRYDLKATLRGGLAAFSGVPDPLGTLNSIFAALGVPNLTTGYGMTETGGLTTMTKVGDPPEAVALTVGRLCPDFEVALVSPETNRSAEPGEPGELWVRGTKVMMGYYNKPAETADAVDANGWFHTKDLMSRGDDGFFRFHGRLGDRLKVGGENVDPQEVERLIGTHPKVDQVQVTGVPDRRLGEVTIAFVQLKQGERTTEADIVDFCRSRIASFKVPRYVRFVTEYPMTPSGKIQKYILRQTALADLGL